MNNDLQQLSVQRDTLFKEMQTIERMRRGSLSRQVFLKKDAQGQHDQGPYFVLQSFHRGKKISRRIPADQVPTVQEHVQNFKRFQELADECITLTDQITQIAQGLVDAKKNSRPRISKKKSSRKPKRS
jgi:hypothetical protein